MKLWIVVFEHKFGSDVWPRFQEEEPTRKAEIAEIDSWEGGFAGDFLTIHGPFDVPPDTDTTPDRYTLFDRASGMYVHPCNRLVSDQHFYLNADDAMQAAFQLLRANGWQATEMLEISKV